MAFNEPNLLSWPPAPTTPDIQLGSLNAMGSRGRGATETIASLLLSIPLEKGKGIKNRNIFRSILKCVRE
jgi:hypothetical protein